MKYSEEDIDIMLFDYLEGNLPEDEIKLVESQIASDPLISEELNTWKQSYIQADHYQTAAMESQLLKSSGSFSFTLFLNSVMLVCLTLISSTNPKIDPFSTSTIRHQTITSLTAIKPTSHIDFHNIAIHPHQIMPVEVNSSLKKMLIKEATVKTPLLSPTPEIANLPFGLVDYVIKHPASIETAEAMDAPLITQKVSRKEERALRRMKKKALRDKAASEFIKGNIPYVVPIDPQNF